ncbi:GNAT family N-acetyltransferase [Streptomyces sp. ZYX-F-203]
MGAAIRTAGGDDRDVVVRLLDRAFLNDPVSGWVFPDMGQRRATHHRLMAALTDVALAEGRVDLTADGSACALWLQMTVEDREEVIPDEGPSRIRQAVDPDNERVELIARLTAEVHPDDRPHAYLWMLGVEPGRQGAGLGTALVESALDRCDRGGLPAYLEASTARSRDLYARLGFRLVGGPLRLPDGPLMWPMWRDPCDSSS